MHANIHVHMCVRVCMRVVENTILLPFCVVIVSSVAFRDGKQMGRLATSRSCCIVCGQVRTRLYNHVLGLPGHFLLVLF